MNDSCKIYVLILCSVFGMQHLTVVSAQDVSVEEIIHCWESTSIERLHCKFYRTITNLSPSDTKSPKGPYGQPVNSEPVVNRSDEVEFWRDGSNMRMKCSQYDSNIVGEHGWSVLDTRAAMEGFWTVTEQARGNSHVQSDLLTDEMLTWSDPLATRNGARVKDLIGGRLPTSNHKEWGTITTIDMPSGDKLFQIILGEQCDWRPMLVREIVRGKLSKETKFLYDRKDMKCVLSKINRVTNYAGPQKTTLEITEVNFSFPSNDLVTQIPKDKAVVSTLNGSEYIVRSGKTKRSFTSEEARVKTVRQIEESEPPQTPNAAKGIRWAIVGLLFAGGGIMLLITRQKTIKSLS